MELLRQIAREMHTDSTLLHWLGAPAVTPHMLGLPSTVAACVFAVEGVLTTSAALHAAAWREALDSFLLAHADRNRRQFIPFDRHHDYAEYLAGKPRIAGVHAFLASRGISLPEGTPGDPPGALTVHGLGNLKRQALQRRLGGEGVAAYAGSRSFLEGARMAGLGRAVVSASTNTAAILDRAGLAHLIDTRIDGSTIEAEHLEPKPAPDLLLEACRRLGVDPSEAAAFETTPAGVAAARSAAVRVVIGVDRAREAGSLLGSDADRIVTDLSQLFDRDAAASEL